MFPFDIPLDQVRLRQSAKWTKFGDAQTLPLPVAEMDVNLAEPIREVLQRALTCSDTGYSGDPTPMHQAFAQFAAQRWDWRVDSAKVRSFGDVAVAIMETLRALSRHRRKNLTVLTMPPVYPPFAWWPQAVGARHVQVGLCRTAEGGYRMDLPAIDEACRAGVDAIVLCHPHNPVGLVHPVDDLQELARIATEHQVMVLSDEIHGPLDLPHGTVFVPFLQVSDDARKCAVAFTSASKAWNLAGLKCAVAVAEQGEPWHVLQSIDAEAGYTRGHWGVLAATAAFTSGAPWLDSVQAALAANVSTLDNLLSQHLPLARWQQPEASFLAWVDLSAYNLGARAATQIAQMARVAFIDGEDFGPGGEGHVRINLACHPDLLSQALQRTGEALALRIASSPD